MHTTKIATQIIYGTDKRPAPQLVFLVLHEAAVYHVRHPGTKRATVQKHMGAGKFKSVKPRSHTFDVIANACI